MIDRMKWADAYDLWRIGGFSFPDALSAPITPEVVSVDYKREGYLFYGYDWLYNADAQERKRLISDDPVEFMYFTQASNKGTITTLQMLTEAQNEEERAAVWIAATTFDLMGRQSIWNYAHYAHELNIAACAFLRERYRFLWHHAMRKLVPEIMIPYTVLNRVNCNDADTVMGLIQMNVMLIKGSYTPLLYSSIEENDPKFKDIAAKHRLHE